MALIQQKQGKDFVPHPPTDGAIRGVVVDVTPPVTKPDLYHPGENKVTTRIVFETEMKDADGKPCLVWSKPLALSFSPPGKYPGSGLYLLTEKIIGRDIKADEGFDDEQKEGIIIIGQSVKLIVEHTTKENETYANISYIKADASPGAYKASGTYVRKKDRTEDAPAGKEYAKAATAPEPMVKNDWSETKIHVGQYAGQKLGSIPQEGAAALIDKWIPAALAQPKMSADDLRLHAALLEVKAILAETAAPQF